MPENNLIMLVGLAGSGKTSFAQSVINGHDDFVIHSSDDLRKELYGDENHQANNNEVFTELHRRIKEDLRNGKNVVYDATNLNRKRRMSFLYEIRSIPCKKIASLIMTEFNRCLEQNLSRERTIPESAIYRQYCLWQPVSIYEGFNSIDVHFSDEPDSKYNKYGFWTNGDYPFMDFDQENSHHTYTLGEHLKVAHDYVKNMWPENRKLEAAISLHDIGKAYTKSFTDRHGNITPDAKYYEHHKVSAYESLFYLTYNPVFKDFSLDDRLYIANLIERHMSPYMEWRQSAYAKEKDIKRFGVEFVSDIEKLHQADIYAH